MSSPTPPVGKFATTDDVADRFEGTFPSNRLAWAATRIGVVERALMREVASLRKPLVDIEADNEAIGDPDRLDRVKDLVADKVLALHRNPDGSTTRFQAMDGLSESRSYDKGSVAAGAVVTFTEAELASVRLPKRKRPKLRTLGVEPWGIPC